MKRAYNDPTYINAAGRVDKEIKIMTRLAINIQEGRGSPSYLDEMRKKFTGIYARLLEEPVEELRKRI